MDASTPRDTRSLTHRETVLVVFGVLLPVFMGSLDNTILAGALPTIGREFGDVHSLPWLITAYLIANTAVTPLYGKISDIYGRKTTLLIAISLYMAGSLVCALAPNMIVLILGRVLHGLGGGGLTSSGMVILGDIAAPRDRGRYYGYFSATYTTAGACGPALGGFLAEYFHWSVIFWINIPMGVLAVILTLTLLHRLPRRERPHRLDFLGAGLVMTASVSFMLALSLTGERYAWTSPPILGLYAVALVVGIGFVVRLLTAPEPLIPLSILSDKVARYAIVVNAFGWGPIVGLNIFMPMYLQSILGMSATVAGLCVLVLPVALNASAGFAGQTIARVEHYKTLPIIGLALSIVAVLILGWRADGLPLWSFMILLAVIGIGFGAIPPLCSTVLQNTVSIHQFGTAVATMQFSRNLCCTIMVAVFGALVLVGAPAMLPDQLAPIVPGSGGALGEYRAEGFGRVFYAAAASFAVALIALVLLEEKPLQTTHN
jgi:EmrB/QacA subfamily drug resistance transporter